MKRIAIAAVLALSFGMISAGAKDAEPLCTCTEPDGKALDIRVDRDGNRYVYVCLPISDTDESCAWFPVGSEPVKQ